MIDIDEVSVCVLYHCHLYWWEYVYASELAWICVFLSDRIIRETYVCYSFSVINELMCRRVLLYW